MPEILEDAENGLPDGMRALLSRHVACAQAHQGPRPNHASPTGRLYGSNPIPVITNARKWEEAIYRLILT